MQNVFLFHNGRLVYISSDTHKTANLDRSEEIQCARHCLLNRLNKKTSIQKYCLSLWPKTYEKKQSEQTNSFIRRDILYMHTQFIWCYIKNTAILFMVKRLETFTRTPGTKWFSPRKEGRYVWYFCFLASRRRKKNKLWRFIYSQIEFVDSKQLVIQIS